MDSLIVEGCRLAVQDQAQRRIMASEVDPLDGLGSGSWGEVDVGLSGVERPSVAVVGPSALLTDDEAGVPLVALRKGADLTTT